MTEREKGEDIAAVIERILMAERSETEAFIRIQQRKLHQLQMIQKRKDEGKTIHRKRIISELQASGILDENEELAEPYSCRERR